MGRGVEGEMRGGNREDEVTPTSKTMATPLRSPGVH